MLKTQIDYSKISWFGTGGIVENYYIFESIEQLAQFIKLKQSFHIVGAGSNTLFLDAGIKNLIKLNLRQITILSNKKIYVQSGVLTSQLTRFCIQNNIGGLEFTSTIPGSIGGLIKMNAGAYGFEIKDALDSVELMNELGETYHVTASQLNFSYRKSDLPDKTVIVGGVFNTTFSPACEIEKNIKTMHDQRKSTQPLNLKTLGSTFINGSYFNPITQSTQFYHSGYLLEQAGLKGYTVGGARFSNKHANFIENFNHCTSQNVLDLIKYAQQAVWDKFQIPLTTEIIII